MKENKTQNTRSAFISYRLEFIGACGNVKNSGTVAARPRWTRPPGICAREVVESCAGCRLVACPENPQSGEPDLDSAPTQLGYDGWLGCSVSDQHVQLLDASDQTYITAHQLGGVGHRDHLA